MLINRKQWERYPFPLFASIIGSISETHFI